MQEWQFALIMMMGYLLISLAIGILAGRGRNNSVNEFAVAGRNLGFLVTVFLMGGAVFSAGSLLGVPGWAFSVGGPVLYFIVYLAFALVPWYFIGPKMGKIGKKFNLYTVSGFLQGRFQNKSIPIIVGVISVLAFVQYLATQLKGMAYIFNIMTEGRIPFWLGALIAYGIVVIYVATGGLRAAAWSDVFQSLLMVIVSWVVGIGIVTKLHGSGTVKMFTTINDLNPGFLTIGHEGSSMNPIGYTTLILVSFVGLVMWPHLLSKSFSAEPKIIKRTILVYPIFALMLIPLVLAGFAAIGVVGADEVAPDEVIPHLIIQVLNLPGWIYGLVGAGVLAAAMSSADAITHSASLEFTDGVILNIKNSISEKTTLLIMRIAVVVIGGIAYCITIFGGSGIITLLLGAYGSIAQFAPAVFSALYWKRATPVAVLAGMITGTVVNFYFQLVANSTPLDIHPGILGLIINFIVLVLLSYTTKPQDEKVVNNYVEVEN